MIRITKCVQSPICRLADAHTAKTVVYSWIEGSPVQLPSSLSLPGMTSLDGVEPGKPLFFNCLPAKLQVIVT